MRNNGNLDTAIILVLIPLCVLLLCAVKSSQKEKCREWASRHGLAIVEMEDRTFSCGPYFRTKNESVYRIVAEPSSPESTGKKRTFWILFGLVNKAKEEVSPGNYSDLDAP